MYPLMVDGQAVCKENGIRYFNLLPSLRGVDPKKLWVTKEDPHPNNYAHSLIAKEIFNVLKMNME